jgi:hypothetical protein
MVNDPNCAHGWASAAGRLDLAVENILQAVRGFHLFGDGRCSGQLAKRGGKGLPIVLAEAECEKERGLAAVVRMGGVQEVAGDFVLVHHRKMGMGQFHSLSSKPAFGMGRA